MSLIEKENTPNIIDPDQVAHRRFLTEHRRIKKEKANPEALNGQIEFGSFSPDSLWILNEWLESEPRSDTDSFPEVWKDEDKLHGKFLKHMYRWGTDASTINHLDPPLHTTSAADTHPQISAMREMIGYYLNKQEDFDPETDPHKITTLWSKYEDRPAGVVTLRWRGDPFMKDQPRDVASFERLIVAPEARGKGIGTKLSANAVEHAFYQRDVREVRAWIMTDRQAEPWTPNFYLFRKLGFQAVIGDVPHWREYARERNIETYGRDALWLYVTKDLYLNSPYARYKPNRDS